MMIKERKERDAVTNASEGERGQNLAHGGGWLRQGPEHLSSVVGGKAECLGTKARGWVVRPTALCPSSLYP